MKKYFLAGCFTLLPLALTVFIVNSLLDLITRPFMGIIETLFSSGHGTHFFLHHHTLILILSRLVIVIFLFLAILVLGYLGRKYFFKYVLNFFNRMLLKIPFVRRVYKLVQDVASGFFSTENRTFKKTVLIPFPSQDFQAIGFVTSHIPSALSGMVEKVDTVVFVPTAPHPLSGFILLTSHENVVDLNISTQEAFKFLLSCGIVHPHPEVKEKS